jgi:hypothetical protein
MNFIVICLHSLDMRDFHSHLRATPCLDSLRSRSVFIPMGRAQGHHQGDSLNAELTGVWTARCSNSILDGTGYKAPDTCHLPKTVIEYLQDAGYEIFTCIAPSKEQRVGTWAVEGGMRRLWLRGEPERLKQFSMPRDMTRSEWLTEINRSKRFYAHIFLRDTHRPWAGEGRLYAMMGPRAATARWIRRALGRPSGWPGDAYYARRAALERPDEFAVLRREGLAEADSVLAEILEATQGIDDVTYVIYSNHGEVFDHFRYNLPYTHSTVSGLEMLEGTSHGNYPYEVLYANMQMWMIPGRPPSVMRGIGRSIDFAPTILDLAGVEPKAMDGESMLEHFSEGIFPDRDRYAESPISGGCLSMVRKDGYKLVTIGAGGDGEDNTFALRGFAEHRLAVFDLESDPFEYVNLLETQQGQEVLDWAISRHGELGRLL